MSFDPRDTLILDGTAAAELEGVVAAERYAETPTWVVQHAVAAIRREPSVESAALDELLYGESFTVLQPGDEVVFGQASRDGYVGWVEAKALAEPEGAATHRVTALRTPVFARPDIKSRVVALLSLNSLARIDDGEGRFLSLAGLGWAPSSHFAPLGEAFATDPAGVAERFLGAPYIWGGRSSLGLDCSGLVQQALYACGQACPRDTDQQRALGAEVGRDALTRNDLVFWRGHVGIMLDAERLLHANAHHMAVAIEPLETALARIAATGNEATAFRRL